MNEMIQHVELHQDILRTWLKMGERLQIGSDYLKPLIKPFNDRFPEVNVYGNCPSCILDMIQWALLKFDESKTPKKKKNEK